jgi:ribonuclease BN (tRNA processing enzyme)
MEIFNEYWKKEYTIDKKYKIKGWSRGGLQTGFILEPCKIFLDAGIPAIIKPNMILITHAHQDHINSLYNHLLDTKNVPVICSIDIVNFLQDYLNANKSLNALQKSKFNNWHPIPIVNKKTINVSNTNYLIEAYDLDHDVKTLGYGINEIRSKLKEEYINLEQSQIEELKKSNIEITNNVNYPILFFCGDMNYTSLEILPFETYPVFIIECSFLNDEHLNEAREKKHLHIKDLIPYVETNKNTKFIFIHFSLRYNKSEIKLYKTKYSHLENLIFWI